MHMWSIGRGLPLEILHRANDDDDDAGTLCIHSVVVSEKLRRQKLGTRLMKEYLHHMSTNQFNVKLVLLICKDKLRSFYASCGTFPPTSSLLRSVVMTSRHSPVRTPNRVRGGGRERGGPRARSVV